MSYQESLKKLQEFLKAKEHEKALSFGIELLDDFEDQVNADYYFTMAKANLALKRYADAEYYLLKTTSLDAENLNSLMLLAKVKMLQEEYALAEEFMEELLTKKPDFLKAIALTAEIKQQLGLSEDASEIYHKVLNHADFKNWADPERLEFYLKTAEFHIDQMEYKEALETLEAEASKEFNELLENMRYQLYLALGEEYKEQLITSARTLYKNVPAKAEYGLNLSQWINEMSEKEEIFTQCLSLELNDEQKARFLAERAYVRIKSENWSAALDDYNNLLELDEDAFFYQKRALAKENTADIKGAIQDLSMALKMETDLYILEQRALLFGKAKAYDKAISDLKTVLKLNQNGNNADTYYNLGVMYSKKGEKSDAVKMLIRADQEDHKKATEFLLQKYPEQLKKIRSKNQTSLKEEYQAEAARNAKSPILSLLFNKLWCINMSKFIEASKDELMSYPSSITKMVLTKLSKEMLILTEDAILLFEGDAATPLEALYRVEVESEHAILLEIQPTKGGPSSNMRISFYEDNLLLHYPVAEEDSPAKYFVNPSEVSPEQLERLNNKTTGLPYVESIESVIGQLS